MTELEVTGVSRSGRVRKKSSKLTDFESLDEIDIRSNSRIKKEKIDGTTPTAAPRVIKKERIIKEEISDIEEGDLTATSNSNVKQEQYSEESDEGFQQHNDESSMDSLGSEMDEVDDGELDQEDGFQPLTGDDSSDESPQRGIYSSDRTKKKVTIKDGKFLGKVKSSKKDRGFWKRRGGNSRGGATIKKQGNTIGQSSRSTVVSQTTVQEQQQLMGGPVGQVRKAKTSPTRKFGGKQSQQPLQQQPLQQQQQQQQQQLSHSQLATTAHVNTSPTVTSIDSKTHPKSGITSETSVFKPVSTSAMDVAAHLKLLGESLTIIGERLTEHEGQIAVSGSFSVLLDSLLCALGPLLCLTQQVPQMNVVPQEQLSQMMDNIAYIMPGL